MGSPRLRKAQGAVAPGRLTVGEYTDAVTPRALGPLPEYSVYPREVTAVRRLGPAFYTRKQFQVQSRRAPRRGQRLH